jgi:flagellar biosynthesis regulator FlbT
MKQALVVMQHCLSIDTRVEKRKVYRRKQKRRKLRERKLLKQQPKPQPTETP